MFNFFKRSKSRIDQRQQKNACATNESNREKLQKPVEEKPIKTTAAGPAAVSQSLQQLHQYEHESIGERALSSSNSNTTKSGFFDIMAKGKNRRNNGKNKQHQQQQQQLKQKANGQPTPSFTDRDQRNNVQTPASEQTIQQLISKPQPPTPPPAANPVPRSAISHQKLNNENISKKVDSNDVACENNTEIYDEPKNSKIIENNYKTNTNANNNNNELATNCVHDNDVARHPSDKNSEQKQYGDCTADNGNENGAADFIKGIIFEKYKRPQSPIHIRPPPELIGSPTKIDNVDASIMGQQPTKVQQSTNIRSTKFKTQPSYTSSQASSTPSTPYDEKDIFYEAVADIPAAVDRFPFTRAEQVNNDNPGDGGDTSITLTTTTNIVPSENFESKNIDIWANENNFSGIVHEPSNNNNNNNNVVLQSAVDNNSNSNGANGDGYDDRRNIVINNGASLSVIEEKITFSSDEHDSPDSGIDVEISDISQVIDKLQHNSETEYSNKSTSLSDDNCSNSSCSNNGGSGCDQSAFKENLENSNDTSYANSENDDIDTPLPTTNVSAVNSNVNLLNNDNNINNSAIRQSDEKQQQYSQQKKRTLLEDTVSLPDIVESTGNGIVIMNHTDEDVNQRQHHNNNGIVDKISTVGQTNGIEK